MNVGDVVRHKSGGRLMVVTDSRTKSRWGYNADVVWCEWITRKGDVKTVQFAVSSVEIQTSPQQEKP